MRNSSLLSSFYLFNERKYCVSYLVGVSFDKQHIVNVPQTGPKSQVQNHFASLFNIEEGSKQAHN